LQLIKLDSNTGSVLFGGIDTEKYQGSLAALPFQNDPHTGTIVSFLVQLSSIEIIYSNGTKTSITIVSGTQVVLEGSTTLMYLPDNVADSIASQIGASYLSGSYYVFCSIGDDERAGVNIGFGTNGGPSIFVPINELVFPAFDTSQNPLTDANGRLICLFGIQRSGDDTSTFGDAFLRSAYVVYDLTHNQAYIAQTIFNTTKSNIMEITGAGNLPNGVTSISTSTSASTSGSSTQTTAVPSVTVTNTMQITNTGSVLQTFNSPTLAPTTTSNKNASSRNKPTNIAFLFSTIVVVVSCILVVL